MSRQQNFFGSSDTPLPVGEYLGRVNEVLGVGKAFVVGEVTDFRKGTQWVSFALKDKDDEAILKCVLGGWAYKKIGVELEDGMEVKVSGLARITKKYGTFGLWVETIEPVGEGSLKKAYQLLLKKLEAEGLFARKRPLPEFIERIGVISSRDGVVIHDLRKNLAKLGYKIFFRHSLVEGASSAGPLATAIEQMSKMPGLDVLVVIRGGGSLESLQGFNNEEVARAIFASPIPVVVGIGHEVDVPIASLVADQSASTPTAVAHLINASWDGLFERLPNLALRLEHGFISALDRVRSAVSTFIRDVDVAFGKIFLRFNQVETNYRNAFSRISEWLTNTSQFLSSAEKMLVLGSPERNLKLGYSIVSNSRGKVVKSTRDVTMGETISARVSDGTIKSEVTK